MHQHLFVVMQCDISIIVTLTEKLVHRERIELPTTCV